MLARALVHEPRLLFLDEPTTGLDPQARLDVWELIDALRRDGLGIVLTTHYMDEAERLADALLVLRDGRTVAAGPPRAVLGDWVGEHVLVLDARDPAVPAVCDGRGSKVCRNPVGCSPPCTWPWTGRGWPGSAPGSAICGSRSAPTLDDLFLKLAEKP